MNIRKNVSFKGLTATVIADGVTDSHPFFVYCNDEDEKTFEKYSNIVFVNVISLDWERDLSPFPHAKVFKGGTDFSGEADQYLERFLPLTEKIEKELGFVPKERVISGYSLAGLFALYASLFTDRFTCVNCVSGSLWYPGFLSLLKEKGSMAEKIYFSIGRKESQTKNQFLSKGLVSMQEAYDFLSSASKETKFEINEGGHFENVSSRMQKGLDWLLFQH
ncbi:MAG: alpha/beta hydrolase-fold protein [Bacilli bacterium]